MSPSPNPISVIPLEELESIPSEGTKVIWSGRFLDGNLMLGIHPALAYQILFSIESDDGCIINGKVRIAYEPSRENMPFICDEVISTLTQGYLEVIQEVKNELISEGSESLH